MDSDDDVVYVKTVEAPERAGFSPLLSTRSWATTPGMAGERWLVQTNPRVTDNFMPGRSEARHPGGGPGPIADVRQFPSLFSMKHEPILSHKQETLIPDREAIGGEADDTIRDQGDRVPFMGGARDSQEEPVIPFNKFPAPIPLSQRDTRRTSKLGSFFSRTRSLVQKSASQAPLSIGGLLSLSPRLTRTGSARYNTASQELPEEEQQAKVSEGDVGGATGNTFGETDETFLDSGSAGEAGLGQQVQTQEEPWPQPILGPERTGEISILGSLPLDNGGPSTLGSLPFVGASPSPWIAPLWLKVNRTLDPPPTTASQEGSPIPSQYQQLDDAPSRNTMPWLGEADDEPHAASEQRQCGGREQDKPSGPPLSTGPTTHRLVDTGNPALEEPTLSLSLLGLDRAHDRVDSLGKGRGPSPIMQEMEVDVMCPRIPRVVGTGGTYNERVQVEEFGRGGSPSGPVTPSGENEGEDDTVKHCELLAGTITEGSKQRSEVVNMSQVVVTQLPESGNCRQEEVQMIREDPDRDKLLQWGRGEPRTMEAPSNAGNGIETGNAQQEPTHPAGTQCIDIGAVPNGLVAPPSRPASLLKRVTRGGDHQEQHPAGSKRVRRSASPSTSRHNPSQSPEWGSKDEAGEADEETLLPASQPVSLREMVYDCREPVLWWLGDLPDRLEVLQRALRPYVFLTAVEQSAGRRRWFLPRGVGGRRVRHVLVQFEDAQAAAEGRTKMEKLLSTHGQAPRSVCLSVFDEKVHVLLQMTSSSNCLFSVLDPQSKVVNLKVLTGTPDNLGVEVELRSPEGASLVVTQCQGQVSPHHIPIQVHGTTLLSQVVQCSMRCWASLYHQEPEVFQHLRSSHLAAAMHKEIRNHLPDASIVQRPPTRICYDDQCIASDVTVNFLIDDRLAVNVVMTSLENMAGVMHAGQDMLGAMGLLKVIEGLLLLVDINHPRVCLPICVLNVAGG